MAKLVVQNTGQGVLKGDTIRADGGKEFVKTHGR
jgi:hypothetical protein